MITINLFVNFEGKCIASEILKDNGVFIEEVMLGCDFNNHEDKMISKSLKPKSPQTDRILSPTLIFWRFTQDTLLTIGIYAVLVVSTLILHWLAELVKEPTFYQQVLACLEHAIFISGTFVVSLIFVYVAMITATDLYHSFRQSMASRPSA